MNVEVWLGGNRSNCEPLEPDGSMCRRETSFGVVLTQSFGAHGVSALRCFQRRSIGGSPKSRLKSGPRVFGSLVPKAELKARMWVLPMPTFATMLRVCSRCMGPV